MPLKWFKHEVGESLTAKFAALDDLSYRLLFIMRELAADEDRRGALNEYIDVTYLTKFVQHAESDVTASIQKLADMNLIRIRDDGVLVVTGYNTCRSESAKRADRRRTNAGQTPGLFGSTSAPEEEVEVEQEQDKEQETPPPTPAPRKPDNGQPEIDFDALLADWNTAGPGPTTAKVSPKARELLTALLTAGDASGFVWTREALKTAYAWYLTCWNSKYIDYKWPTWEDALSRTCHQKNGPGLMRFLPREGYDPRNGCVGHAEKLREKRRRGGMT